MLIQRLKKLKVSTILICLQARRMATEAREMNTANADKCLSMVIFKRKILKNLSLGVVDDRDGMNEQLFTECIKEYFMNRPESVLLFLLKSSLLIFDSACCHLLPEAIEAANYSKWINNICSL